MASKERSQTRLSRDIRVNAKRPDTTRSISFFCDYRRDLSPKISTQRKINLKEKINYSLNRYSTKNGLKQAKKVYVHSLREAMNISCLSRKNEIISTEGDSQENFRALTRQHSKKKQKMKEGRVLKKRENPELINLNVEEYMKIKSPSFIRPRRLTDKAILTGCKNNNTKKLDKNIGRGIQFRENNVRIKSMGSSFLDLEPWEVSQIKEEFLFF